ncbi:hypothetical protein SCG7086_CX_00010 [Chlamydiales bacterium SCGC AG-110-P3]|nr:hypothetical protein SCG7086_CX_00010 [Chlamydiales bacterium SCGC AG-110-P3]
MAKGVWWIFGISIRLKKFNGLHFQIKGASREVLI